MVGIWGKVEKVVQDRKQRQILDVFLHERKQNMLVMHFVYANNRCQVGDQVQVNTSAVDLNLGTGGYGFVKGVISARDHAGPEQDLTYLGHIMKIRYTGEQRPVCTLEAQESEHRALFQSPFSLQGKRVVVGELHSMLPVFACLLQQWRPERKLVYIMDDQATLQIAFSDHIAQLQGSINMSTITYGQATGGDVETVNIYTALEAAIKVEQADDILITQGPGVVGTGSIHGFSGMHLAHWIHAIHTCGGESIVIPRIQFADQRTRHQGLSHHTCVPLRDHTLVRTNIPYPVWKDRRMAMDDKLLRQVQELQAKHKLIPIGIEQIKDELEQALDSYPYALKTMGRTYEDDPYFFYAIAATFDFYRREVMR